MKIYIDTETYSEVPIKHGLSNYAAEVEVLLVTYALDDADVKLWDRTADKKMPSDLRAALDNPNSKLVAHNAQFDLRVLRGIINLPTDRWICTQAQAQAHGLPGSLAALCDVFGLTGTSTKKDGMALIRLFCMPNNKGERRTAQTHPVQWAEFCEYAMSDITAMRIIHAKMPSWNYPQGEGYQTWLLDQTINQRGFCVDLELVDAAIIADDIDKKDLKQRAKSAMKGEVESATQGAAVLKYILEAYGVTLPDLRADTVRRRIEDPNVPEGLKVLLELRLAAGRNSASKYKAVRRAASADGRLRNTLRFAGASGTGRWAAHVFNVQNMMRPTMSAAAIEEAIADIKSGYVNAFYDNVAEVLGNCVRGTVIAPEGKKLVVCDLSSIEGRMLAWLAGEDYMTDFFGQVDRKEVAYDSYMLDYAKCFDVPPESVTKAQRTIGKPINLAFGYAGGVAAFLTFAMVYHIDLPEVAKKIHASADPTQLAEAYGKYDWARKKGYSAGLPKEQYAAFEYTKCRWRDARPKTVVFWKALATAFENAVMFEGEVFMAGAHIKVRRDGDWLRIRLPSGRALTFLRPEITETGLTYAGISPYTHKWDRISTHGGKLAGIVTQASANDILRVALHRLEDAGYPTVFHVHDEVVCEVPDTEAFSVEGVREHMTAPIAWAQGLPLNAEGFETYRYRKE